VAVTVTSGTDTKKCTSTTYTATGDTRIAASNKTTGDQANPAVTLATNADFNGMVYACLFSGQNAPASITAGTTANPNYQSLSGQDFGSQSTLSQYGQQAGANVVCGFTSLSEDVAMVAAAIEAIPEPRARDTNIRQAVGRGATR
jgi:hypothetical protein